jgi:hypothetical protein
MTRQQLLVAWIPILLVLITVCVGAALWAADEHGDLRAGSAETRVEARRNFEAIRRIEAKVDRVLELMPRK